MEQSCLRWVSDDKETPCSCQLAATQHPRQEQQNEPGRHEGAVRLSQHQNHNGTNRCPYRVFAHWNVFGEESKRPRFPSRGGRVSYQTHHGIMQNLHTRPKGVQAFRNDCCQSAATVGQRVRGSVAKTLKPELVQLYYTVRVWRSGVLSTAGSWCGATAARSA